MVHWALNAVAMRHFVHCRKMLDSNLVSQLYTLPDLSDVIFYLLCYKGAITFCRMVILSICSISGLANCLERSYFVSKYHIFNILLEVPNLSSSCKKLMPVSNFLLVLPLNLPHSPIFEKTPTFIAEETARLSLFFFFFLMLDTFSHGISELLRREGLSGGHLVQSFCSGSITRAGCSGPCPLTF